MKIAKISEVINCKETSATSRFFFLGITTAVLQALLGPASLRSAGRSRRKKALQHICTVCAVSFRHGLTPWTCVNRALGFRALFLPPFFNQPPTMTVIFFAATKNCWDPLLQLDSYLQRTAAGPHFLPPHPWKARSVLLSYCLKSTTEKNALSLFQRITNVPRNTPCFCPRFQWLCPRWFPSSITRARTILKFCYT